MERLASAQTDSHETGQGRLARRYPRCSRRDSSRFFLALRVLATCDLRCHLLLEPAGLAVAVSGKNDQRPRVDSGPFFSRRTRSARPCTKNVTRFCCLMKSLPPCGQRLCDRPISIPERFNEELGRWDLYGSGLVPVQPESICREGMSHIPCRREKISDSAAKPAIPCNRLRIDRSRSWPHPQVFLRYQTSICGFPGWVTRLSRESIPEGIDT